MVPEFTVSRHLYSSATLHDVCCGKFADKFLGEKRGNLSTGFGERMYWLKFEPLRRAGVLDFGPMVDDITLFFRDPRTGLVRQSRAGDLVSIGERELNAAHIVFPIDKAAASSEIWARIDHLKISIIKPVFWSHQAFANDNSRAMLVHVSVLSAVGMMIVFNLLLGLWLKQTLYLFYAGSVVTLLIGGLYFTGVGAAYVWTAWPAISNILFDWVVIFGLISSSIFGYLFAKNSNLSFSQQPMAIRILLLPCALAIIVAILWLITPIWFSQISLAAAFTTSTLFSTTLLVFLAIKGNRRAQLMAPAMLLAIIPGNILFLASKFWSIELLIPAEHIIEFVLLTDALLFSLILSFRIRLAESEAVSAYGALDHLQKTSNRKMLQAIDDDRKRIASDLHDTAGQGLLAIANRLGQLLKKHKLSSTSSREIEKAANYSRGVVGDIRRISHELHPAVIDHLGWHNAIEELFSALSEIKGVEVDLNISLDEEKLDENQQLHLYRIVQELLSNIGKHAGAKKCIARIAQIGGCAEVVISDDGQEGQSIQSEGDATAGFGQLIIGQRMDVLAGEWSIERKEKMTIAHLNFPLTLTTISEKSR